jgi:hypothetical protein
MTNDHLFGTVFLLFPFWCLHAKGGEELSIYVFIHRFYLDLTCKTLFSMCWSCGHVFHEKPSDQFLGLIMMSH